MKNNIHRETLYLLFCSNNPHNKNREPHIYIEYKQGYHKWQCTKCLQYTFTWQSCSPQYYSKYNLVI